MVQRALTVVPPSQRAALVAAIVPFSSVLGNHVGGAFVAAPPPRFHVSMHTFASVVRALCWWALRLGLAHID